MNFNFRFVESADGSLEGINDAGIETYAGNRLASLAREQGQNSLDARNAASNGPVDVEYQIEALARADLPGADELAVAIDHAITYWSDSVRHHRKTIQILNKAKRTLARDQIKILRISDRNTTGLLASDKVEQGDWFSLTKASGVSLKGDDALGSYGIGKNVFWLNSALRTVFFSTQDMEGKYAFQGVTKLVSHPIFDARGKQSGLTRSIGFYGVADGYLPIRSKAQVPKHFRVSQVGTDIFLAGFEPFDDWEKGLIVAFAESFFAAFQRDALRVRIAQHEISSATIAPIIDGLYNSDNDRFRYLRDYFDCLTSSEAKTFEEDLPHIGHARLRLILREGAKKRIAMFRATGMMIFEKGHFRTPLEFAGVCICDDPEGNKFLRRLEPPSHDAWEPERNDEDTQAARDAIGALNSWLRKCVQSLLPDSDAATIEIPDLERYLPDDEDDEPIDSPKGESEGDPMPHDERVLEGKSKRPQRPGLEASGDGGLGDEEGDAGGGEENQGGGGDRGTKGGEAANETEIAVPVRIFMDPASDSRYLLQGEFPSNGRYAVYLYAYGDDGRRDPIEIEKPRVKASGDKWVSIPRKGSNAIGPLAVDNKQAIQIEFMVPSKLLLTLSTRVTKYAD
jgi:hypothetical protein